MKKHSRLFQSSHHIMNTSKGGKIIRKKKKIIRKNKK